MYNSPIEVMITDIQHQIVKQQDEEIYKAVVNVGIHVDKEELIRALQDDRRQYEEGYRDGRLSAKEEIVRCKDCKHCSKNTPDGLHWCNEHERGSLMDDDFCSYGERREG